MNDIAKRLQKSLTAGDAGLHIETCLEAISVLERLLAAAEPLTPCDILRIVTDEVGGVSPMEPLDGGDWISFVRAIEAAHGIGGKA